MVSRDGNYMGLNGEGKPVFMPMEENYKEAVKEMRQLWEEGVVDTEYFTQDGSMKTAKQQADGGSQVGLIFGWTADAEVGPNVDQFKTYLRTSICLLFCCLHGAILCEVLWVNNALFP